jgi:hypothetical protein
MKYWYEITFKDGRYVRREYVSRKLAESIHRAMADEMILFNVKTVAFGVMQ